MKTEDLLRTLRHPGGPICNEAADLIEQLGADLCKAEGRANRLAMELAQSQGCVSGWVTFGSEVTEALGLRAMSPKDIYAEIARLRAKPADLQGLRDALLNSGPIERDEDGYWCNAALPCCDEDVDYAKLLAVFGLEAAIVFAETQMEIDAYEAMCEEGGCNAWTPAPPDGDGWVMASLHDTDDGAAAFYVRPAAPAVSTQRLPPSVSLKWDHDGQGGCYVEMRVNSLRSEGHAHAAMAYMERLFCGPEQQIN